MNVEQHIKSAITTAAQTDDGKLFIQAGFTVHHTGGGCLAWRKELPSGDYILITDEDGTQLTRPHDSRFGHICPSICVFCEGLGGGSRFWIAGGCQSLPDPHRHPRRLIACRL